MQASHLRVPSSLSQNDNILNGLHDWIEKIDPLTGRVYWGNRKTKHTTWNEPEELQSWRQATRNETFWKCVDNDTGKIYFVDAKTGETTWHKPFGKVLPFPTTEKVDSTMKNNRIEKTYSSDPQTPTGDESKGFEAANRNIVSGVSATPFTQNIKNKAKGLRMYMHYRKDGEDYKQVEANLHDTMLTLNYEDGTSLKYSLGRASLIDICEHADAKARFEIRITDVNGSEHCLSMKNLADSLLWLEALLVAMQRAKANLSKKPQQICKEGISFRDKALEPTQSVRQVPSHYSFYSKNRYRDLFTRHGAALVIQQTFRRRKFRRSITQCHSKHGEFQEWLYRHNLQQFECQIREAGYDDVELLSRLTEEDLKEFMLNDIKLAKPGHRMRVFVAARELAKDSIR